MEEPIIQAQSTTEPITPEQPKQPQRTLLLTIILIVMLCAAGIGFVVIKNNKSQEIPIEIPVDDPIVEPIKKEKAHISIDPEVQTVKVGQVFTNTIMLDAKTYPLTVVKIVLQYDPEYVSLSTFEPGTFYKNPTILAKTIDNTKGAALITLGSLVARDGAGTIASFSAIAKTTTGDEQTFLTFSTRTSASISGKESETAEKNVLTSFGESVVTIAP